MAVKFADELDAFSRGYLIQAAKRLDESVSCTPCGQDDYLQELQWNLLRRKPWFDPKRARWTTFVRLVTKHRVGELRERCLRGQCRAGTLPCSPAEDGWSFERASLSVHDDLRIDLATHLATLTPDDRELCRLLMQHSIAETARRIGWPITTTKDAISRLRCRFERSSLREYFTDHNSSRRSADKDR